MKRWKIVLPTLLATSGLPLVSLIGCGAPDPEIGKTIILDHYDPDVGWICTSDYLPNYFENNKMYCFKVDLSILGNDYITFFDGKGWCFYFEFDYAINLKKVNIDLYINDIKQTRYEKPTKEAGYDGYCLVQEEKYLTIYGRHINTPPNKDDKISIDFTFYYDFDSDLVNLSFQKLVPEK